MRSWILRAAAAALCVTLVGLGGMCWRPVPVAAQASCRFILGFKALHDQIPAIVGDCVEDEYVNAENGNAEQHTTRGLLVWRKADNWTAFTDGARTWINGPQGLLSRPNGGPLFPWEAGGPSGTAVDRCHTSQLAVGLAEANGAAGSTFATYHLVNRSNAPCRLYGFVGMLMLDADGRPLPTVVQWNGGFFSNRPGPTEFMLNPNTAASFVMRWGNVLVGDETACPKAAYLLITPPDETEPLLLGTQMAPCGHGTIDVTAVLPPGVSPV